MNYIGSKLSLLSFIEETIDELNIEKNNIVLCDIFTGTGVVSKFFKKKGYSIISNDLQFYSYITAKHFIENNKEISFLKLKNVGIDPFPYLNNIDLKEGFIYNNYSEEGTKDKEHTRLYFTGENAKKIDSIRECVENWKQKGLLLEEEYNFLLASLIESADKVANTASVYEAFLKKYKKSALKELVLEPLEVVVSEEEKEYTVYNEDANELIKNIKGDILYLDPPYNTRKYNTNYHMLETISLYDNPELKGKTGVRVDESKKSKYSSKREAENAFEDLVKNAEFKYILLSYNDEGIIPIEKIEEIMSKYGKYSRKEQVYKRFKADSKRKQSKDTVIEYIHCLEKVCQK